MNRKIGILTGLAAVSVFLGGMAAINFGPNATPAGAASSAVAEEGVVVQGQVSTDDALDAASKRLGFRVKAPAFLPTGSRTLKLVDSQLGPPGVPSPLKLANLIYVADDKKVAAGVEYVESVNIFQTDVRLTQPGGEPINAPGVGNGIEVWREKAEDTVPGGPPSVTFTVRAPDGTYLITFLGEQPAIGDLGKMITSFR